MKRFALPVVIVAVLILAASVANATTTYIKCNGLTSTTVTGGTPFVLTMNCASGGDVIVLVSASLNGTTANFGNVGEYRDGDFDDESSTAGLIQRTVKPEMGGVPPGTVMTLTAYEPSSGTSATCSATVTAATTSQGVQGYVYNWDGSPAVNAIVSAAPQAWPNTYAFQASGVTNSSGFYSIDLPSAGSALYTIYVFNSLAAEQSNSFNPLVVNNVLVSNGAMATVQNVTMPRNWTLLVNRATCVVMGTVKDDSGHPLPGVKVNSVYTNMSGNYTYYGNNGDNIIPSLPNYVADAQYFVTSTGAATVNMKMHHGATEVQLTLKDSSTSAAVPYIVCYVDGDYGNYKVDANASGKASLWEDSEAWTYILGCSDDWAQYGDYFYYGLGVGSTAVPTTVDLTKNSATVSGQVTDNETPAKPVPYAQVTWAPSGGLNKYQATSNASGNYSFTVAPGGYNIDFSQNGWGSKGYNNHLVSGSATLSPILGYVDPSPTISQVKMTPVKGTTRTTFEVDAVYTDPSGNAPQSVGFGGSGTPGQALTKNDTSSDYATGVKYTWTGKLPAGVWGFGTVGAINYDANLNATLGPGEPSDLLTVVRLGTNRTPYFGPAETDCGGSVFGLNASGNVWENVYGVWTGLPGTLSTVLAADLNGTGIDNIVGLNSSGGVYMYMNGAWTKSGTLKSIAEGDFTGDGRDGIVGLNASGQIWVYKAGAWSQVPGSLQTVWAGDWNGTGKDGLVGLNASGQIYYTTNLSTWTPVPGHLSGLVVGDFTGAGHDGIAGLNSSGDIYYSMDMSTWNQIPGNLHKIAALDPTGTGQDALVGINSVGEIYYTTDMATWTEIPGNLETLTMGDFTGTEMDGIAGLNSTDQIWVYGGTTWSQLPGSLAILGAKQPMYVLP